MRNLIIATVLLFTAAGLFGGAYVLIGNKEAVLTEQLAAIKINSEREQTHTRLEKIAEESSDDRETLATYFLPHAGESITFLTLVETLAPKNGVTLKTDSLEEGADKKTKEKWVDAIFVFSGTRENVEQFISILENLPYVSRINSVTITAKTVDDWEAKVTIRVFITNYET